MTPRVALFDLDDTLVDRTAAFTRAVHVLADQVGRDPDEFVPYAVEADRHGRRGRRVWLEDLRSRFELPHSVEELDALHDPNYLAAYEPDPTVNAALTRLRAQGWRIGIVTNGPPSQDRKVDRCELRDLVDAVVVSEVVAIRKPDRAIFELACAQAGVDRVAVMIGDSPEADVAGAHARDIASIWIDHGRGWRDGIDPPTHTVAHILDAIEIVAGLG